MSSDAIEGSAVRAAVEAIDKGDLKSSAARVEDSQTSRPAQITISVVANFASYAPLLPPPVSSNSADFHSWWTCYSTSNAKGFRPPVLLGPLGHEISVRVVSVPTTTTVIEAAVRGRF
jgi:hypothetical protein